MRHRNNLDRDTCSGSSNTDNSQASQLQNLDLHLECVQCVQCPRCRDKRRDSRCQRWIEECANACGNSQDGDLDQIRNRDRDQDDDGDDDGDRDGDRDGDGDGERSTWWIKCLSRTAPRYLWRRQREALCIRWRPFLELVLDLTTGLVLLSLLIRVDFEMLLPPFLVFILYMVLTIPLAMLLGSRRRFRRQARR